MSPSVSLLVSIVGVLISGCIGAFTVWVAVRKRLEEEFSLEQVRDECVVIGTLVELGSFGQHRDHLLAEANRIRSEADAMLAEVRARRQAVERSLPTLTAAGLESAIATAYHGKRRAETQLKRTQLSRTEVLQCFQAAQ